MKKILVLTNSKDGDHTDSVLSKLKEKGEKFFRFDTDRIGSGELKIVVSLNGNFEIMAECGEKINFSEIKSIWYRRPNHFNLLINDSVQREYAEGELKIFLENLWLMKSDIFWLNNPIYLNLARKKLYQLRIAQEEFGFKIPPTIITNNSSEIKSFYRRHRGKIIFKAIYNEFLNYGDKSFNIPTTFVGKEHFKQLDFLLKIPCLFQKFIEKKFEFRITVVGNNIFPARIDSQKNPFTIVDWRNPKFIDKLNYEIVDIPKDISQKIINFMKRLKISFGAFDFIVDKNGQFYFLEVNPNGQWYWIENLTGALISEAIADILSIGHNFTERR